MDLSPVVEFVPIVCKTGHVPMKDMAARLEKLRKDAPECARVRDLATDPIKRELFTKLAEHYQVLATEVEWAMKIFGDSAGTFLGRKTQDPFPEEEK